MFEIHEHRDSHLSRAQVRAIVSLTNSIWPNKTKTLDDLTDAILHAAQAHRRDPPIDPEVTPLRFVIWEDDRAIAHAKTFKRTIITPDGPLPVMALGGVCVAATHRGRGLGAAISRKAFERVQQGTFPLALFQTTVPAFYDRLGARTVDNRFVNSRNRQDPLASPWQDVSVMIYPNHYPWPGGMIDLNGPGY